MPPIRRGRVERRRRPQVDWSRYGRHRPIFRRSPGIDDEVESDDAFTPAGTRWDFVNEVIGTMRPQTQRRVWDAWDEQGGDIEEYVLHAGAASRQRRDAARSREEDALMATFQGQMKTYHDLMRQNLDLITQVLVGTPNNLIRGLVGDYFDAVEEITPPNGNAGQWHPAREHAAFRNFPADLNDAIAEGLPDEAQQLFQLLFESYVSHGVIWTQFLASMQRSPRVLHQARTVGIGPNRTPFQWWKLGWISYDAMRRLRLLWQLLGDGEITQQQMWEEFDSDFITEPPHPWEER